jgi:hypothetical protein
MDAPGNFDIQHRKSVPSSREPENPAIRDRRENISLRSPAAGGQTASNVFLPSFPINGSHAADLRRGRRM